MLESIICAFREVHFRGKARLLNSIGPKSGVRSASVFGCIFNLDLAEYIQRQIYFGTFEPGETNLLRGQLRAGMTFVDVGANVGYFTALAASVVGSTGRVIAFEPSPYAFDRLREMARRNDLTNVTLVRAGLSDGPGRLNLYLGVGSTNHSPTMVPHENSVGTSVPVQTLDDAMEQMGIGQIDCMKIDVEGYEPRVIAGAKRLLQERRIGALLCEFNEHWLRGAGSSSDSLGKTIFDAGFIEPRPACAGHDFANRFFLLTV